LLLPDSCTTERATSGTEARPSAKFLAFRVANGHLPARADAEIQSPHGGPSIEREAKRLDLDGVESIEWPDGERALIFEIDVARKLTGRLRVSGPADVAWAL